MSEIRLNTFDNRLMASLTPEERHAHYTALYNFWKSISERYGDRMSLRLAGQYKFLKEKEE